MSDLCSSSGEGVAGVIDSDVTFDDCGLPYIPGKRLKGCLREVALELRDAIGPDFDDNTYHSLFGIPGSHQPGKLILENAYLECYEDLYPRLQYLQTHNYYKEMLQPEYIRQYFTVQRTETSIDPTTGTARDNSLRVLRAIKRGNTFLASVVINDSNEDSITLLKNCCSVLRRMGLARSRGLGEVKCELISSTDNLNEVVISVTGSTEAVNNNYELINGDYYLPYTVKTLSQLIVDNLSGHTRNTGTFIPGSNILGALASLYLKNKGIPTQGAHRNEQFWEIFLSGKVAFLPAYIACPLYNNSNEVEEWVRCLPIPSTIN